MNNDIILQQYWDFVCANYQSKQTREAYTLHPRMMLKWINKNAKELTQKDIDKYTRYCLENKQPNGNYIRFQSIQYFTRWLGKKKIKLPTVRKIDAGKEALNDKELNKIFDTVETLSPLHRLVFYLEYDAIRRPSEITNIKLNDRYGNVLKYKGKTHNRIGVKRCKLTQRCLNAWDDYVKYRRPLPFSEKDAKYLILAETNTRKGMRLLSNVMITRVVKELAMMSHIEPPNEEKPNNYLIKRTSITKQLKQCPDPKIIQLQAGHQQITTTMRYNRVSDDDIDDYLKTMEQKVNPALEQLNTQHLTQKHKRGKPNYVLRYRLLIDSFYFSYIFLKVIIY